MQERSLILSFPLYSAEPCARKKSVKAKVAELQSQFELIQQHMMKVLKADNITLEEFRITVSSFPCSVQLNAVESLEIISDEKGIEYIFRTLNHEFVWNFLDYHLLERIVKIFGSNNEKLLQLMEEYSQALSIFRSSTTVDELMDAWDEPSLPEKCEEYSKIIQTVKWDPKTQTLEELDKLRKNTSKLLQKIPLSEVALVLNHIKGGCVILTWLVSSDLVPHFKSAFAQCIAEGVYFKENDIVSLELDGDIFKSMESVSIRLCLNTGT